MSQRPVTLTDIVAGHVSLAIDGFDRIYLNGWVPALQTSGQVAGWLGWRGFPIASPAALGKISQGFRAAVRRYADGNDIPSVLPLLEQAKVPEMNTVGDPRYDKQTSQYFWRLTPSDSTQAPALARV